MDEAFQLSVYLAGPVTRNDEMMQNVLTLAGCIISDYRIRWSNLPVRRRHRLRRGLIHVAKGGLSLRVHVAGTAAHLIAKSGQLSPSGVDEPVADLDVVN